MEFYNFSHPRASSRRQEFNALEIFNFIIITLNNNISGCRRAFTYASPILVNFATLSPEDQKGDVSGRCYELDYILPLTSSVASIFPRRQFVKYWCMDSSIMSFIETCYQYLLGKGHSMFHDWIGGGRSTRLVSIECRQLGGRAKGFLIFWAEFSRDLLNAQRRCPY